MSYCSRVSIGIERFGYFDELIRIDLGDLGYDDNATSFYDLFDSPIGFMLSENAPGMDDEVMYDTDCYGDHLKCCELEKLNEWCNAHTRDMRYYRMDILKQTVKTMLKSSSLKQMNDEEDTEKDDLLAVFFGY